ncbi:MAG: 2-succinyl-5-enolpyruvyl-6-hydroxy-3-cyclohexene-1-carboxylic-acid synthase [Actinomycetota bacterium]|nr:2-succinyl-5-enolpyruvyl-6-hydroxy-3-cyclohexene-1-carboxylic-acid synthase [Acidimicrobiales bacterium]
MTRDPYLATTAFFTELLNQGLTDILVSPGSRSTALAISAQKTIGLKVMVHLDERSAGFWALGIAKASNRPVVLICTSGTAAANYLPAVAEAHFSEIPLIVITADRPPELQDRGAGQTINQSGIYGAHVRWSCELPIANDVAPEWFQSTAARSLQIATGSRPGPVHLNWPLREPLEPINQASPKVSSKPIMLTRHASVINPQALEVLQNVANHENGLLLAGPMSKDLSEAVASFCSKTGWPLLAEPLSQLRRQLPGVNVISNYDHLLRTPWVERHVPTAVVRIGQPMTSKPLRLWLEQHRPQHLLIGDGVAWTDASTTATALLDTSPEILGQVSGTGGSQDWGKKWVAADNTARVAINEVLDAGPLLEASIAREFGRSLPDMTVLYVSNSMPVRDIDSFFEANSSNLTCFGNRGASGIDGLISSAAGVASTGRTTTLFIGDLAFIHDISGLLAASQHNIDLTIVVSNNNGGGIFSFLPIAKNLDAQNFEKLFTTPQKHSVEDLSKAVQADYNAISSLSELRAALRRSTKGLRIIEVMVDRDANLEQHHQITSSVITATDCL